MAAMHLKACHFHLDCRSPSPRRSHLATSLAPRHVPRTSPRSSQLATPLSQRYFYLPASPLSQSTKSPTMSSTPPLTQSLHHCTPATPQDVTTRNPDVMQSIMPNKHMARGRHSGGELDGRNQDEDQCLRRNRSRRTRSVPQTHGTTHGTTQNQIISGNSSHLAHRETACVPHATHLQPRHWYHPQVEQAPHNKGLCARPRLNPPLVEAEGPAGSRSFWWASNNTMPCCDVPRTIL